MKDHQKLMNEIEKAQNAIGAPRSERSGLAKVDDLETEKRERETV